MNICKFFTLLTVFITSFNSVFALEKEDQLAIEEVIQGYNEAWNQRGCVGFADHFTEDASFVNILGMIFSGKTEIEARHVQILQTFLKDSILQIQSTELREIQPGVVIALVRWKLLGNFSFHCEAHNSLDIREGVFTQVFIKSDHKWEITASQNTLVTTSQ